MGAGEPPFEHATLGRGARDGGAGCVHASPVVHDRTKRPITRGHGESRNRQGDHQLDESQPGALHGGPRIGIGRYQRVRSSYVPRSQATWTATSYRSRSPITPLPVATQRYRSSGAGNVPRESESGRWASSEVASRARRPSRSSASAAAGSACCVLSAPRTSAPNASRAATPAMPTMARATTTSRSVKPSDLTGRDFHITGPPIHRDKGSMFGPANNERVGRRRPRRLEDKLRPRFRTEQRYAGRERKRTGVAISGGVAQRGPVVIACRVDDHRGSDGPLERRAPRGAQHADDITGGPGGVVSRVEPREGRHRYGGHDAQQCEHHDDLGERKSVPHLNDPALMP